MRGLAASPDIIPNGQSPNSTSELDDPHPDNQFTSSPPTQPVPPVPNVPLKKDEIEDILDEKVIST